MTDEMNQSRKWVEDAEEALNRTGDALRAAWEGSREGRMSALEAAREAANRLAEAIDRGAAVARETWESGRERQETSEQGE